MSEMWKTWPFNISKDMPNKRCEMPYVQFKATLLDAAKPKTPQKRPFFEQTFEQNQGRKRFRSGINFFNAEYSEPVSQNCIGGFDCFRISNAEPLNHENLPDDLIEYIVGGVRLAEQTKPSCGKIILCLRLTPLR